MPGNVIPLRPEAASAPDPSSLLDRVKKGWEGLAKRFVNRFQDACDEFRFVRENAAQWRSEKAIKPKVEEIVLAGALMSLKGCDYHPLFEGTNDFAVRMGRLERLKSKEEAEGEAVYQVRVDSFAAYLQVLSGDQRKLPLETNQLLKLGDQSFVVKLVPQAYWVRRACVRPRERRPGGEA